MKWLIKHTCFAMAALLALAFPVWAAEDSHLIIAKPGTMQNNNPPRDMSDPGPAALGNFLSEPLLRRPGTVDQGLARRDDIAIHTRGHAQNSLELLDRGR